jgi:hypothetical protein
MGKNNKKHRKSIFFKAIPKNRILRETKLTIHYHNISTKNLVKPMILKGIMVYGLFILSKFIQSEFLFYI